MVFFGGDSSCCLFRRGPRATYPAKALKDGFFRLLPTSQLQAPQTERDWREVSAPGGSGDHREAGAGRQGVREGLDGVFPHQSWAGGKRMGQQAGEDGGWDVSHLASRSRWGWG